MLEKVLGARVVLAGLAVLARSAKVTRSRAQKEQISQHCGQYLGVIYLAVQRSNSAVVSLSPLCFEARADRHSTPSCVRLRKSVLRD